MTRSYYNPWIQSGYRPVQVKRQRIGLKWVALILAVALIALAVLTIYDQYAPPGYGTIIKKGIQQGMASPTGDGSIAYYLCIESPDQNHWWTWYVDINTYAQYAVGDSVGVI